MLNSDEEPVFKQVLVKPSSWWDKGGHKHKYRVQSIVQMVLCKKKNLWYCNVPCDNDRVISYRYLFDKYETINNYS